MFTGLVQKTGRVDDVRLIGPNTRLAISVPSDWDDDLVPGESIACNGVCLTVADLSGQTVLFDAVPETLSRTNLGDLRPGDLINLERSLKLEERLGGHFVLGHVDRTGEILEIERSEEGVRFRIGGIGEDQVLVVRKGSVAVDGISLTVSSLFEGGFEVAIVPYTLEHSNLKSRRPRDRVNIEFDYLVKSVRRFLELGDDRILPAVAGVLNRESSK